MKSPLATTLLMGMAVVSLLVTVMTCTELMVPTETVPKLIEVGDMLTARMPVPVAFCTCAATLALLFTAMPPIWLPVTSGEKVAVTVQDLPAAKEPPQGVAPLGVTE